MDFSQDGSQFILPPYATQKKKARRAPVVNSAPPTEDDTTARKDLLWSEKYEPKTEEDLAVRVQKIRDVKAVLESSCLKGPYGRYKYLILTGPAGCGKSTLIRVLAKTLNYRIVEWNNSQRETLDELYESSMSKFEQFLRRATHLDTLENPEEESNKQAGRIILLDDIPDLLEETSKVQFHAALQSVSNIRTACLLVVVVSEAWTAVEGSRSSKSTEAQLAGLRDIVPQSILESPACKVIEFNPIITSTLVKNLAKIQDLEVKRAWHVLDKEKLVEIAQLSQGDIRCAINTLQFYCTPLEVPVLPEKRKRDHFYSPIQEEERNISESMGTRGGPIELFHALGKVLHAKRDEQGRTESIPEEILPLLPVDPDLFITYLHENFIKFHDDISQCAEALQWLSQADCMAPTVEWKDPAIGQYQCLLAMRGIMKTRTKPIHRKMEINKPMLFQALRDRRGNIESSKSQMTTVQDTQSDPAQWGDDIEEDDPMSVDDDDDDDEFDNIFGAGDDLAALAEY